MSLSVFDHTLGSGLKGLNSLEVNLLFTHKVMTFKTKMKDV